MLVGLSSRAILRVDGVCGAVAAGLVALLAFDQLGRIWSHGCSGRSAPDALRFEHGRRFAKPLV